MTVRLGRIGAAAWVVVGVALLGGCATRIGTAELAAEYYNLGNAFFRLGDYDASWEYYTRALELDSALPPASFNLARLHLERNEPAAAIAVLDELLAGDPRNALYRETRAYARFRAGAIDAARAEYGELIALYPARARLYYNLGLLEQRAANHAAAVATLEDGLPYAPDDLEYRLLLADAAYESGATETAREAVEFARVLAAEEPDTLVTIAARLERWGYPLPALETLEALAPARAGAADAQFLTARILLLATADFDGGRTALIAAMEAGFRDEEQIRELLALLPEDEQAILSEDLSDYEFSAAAGE